MQHATILNIGAVADGYAFDIASDHGCWPDGYVIAQSHIANDHGTVIDINGCADFGLLVVE
jgi:hypothetical protein